MTQEHTDPNLELRRLVALLDKTAKVAEHGSLTGSLTSGKAYAIRSYNSIRQHVVSTGEAPESLFPPLADNAGLADVGIACAQLAEYLRTGLPEPPRSNRGSHKGAFLKAGEGDVIISLGDLGDIGEMVRERLPEWLRGKRPTPPQPPQPPGAPEPPQPPSGEGAAGEPHVAHLSGLEELRSSEGNAPAEGRPPVAERRREILEALSEGRLSPEEAAAQLEAL
jgi:hypothetical protein